jgi:hypothetical protein
MSDGLSEGYRSAREAEARQERIDGFFKMVLTHVQGGKPDKKAFRAAFDAFEAHRWENSMARYRLEKERGKRWEAFLGKLAETVGKDQTLEDHWVRNVWAELLSLALRFASRKIVEDLHGASPYKGHHIGLYVPNGTGHYGRNPPTLFGDFAAALDAIGGRDRAMVVIIDDPDRAVVGLELGPKGKENLEPERAKLRFLAVRKEVR